MQVRCLREEVSAEDRLRLWADLSFPNVIRPTFLCAPITALRAAQNLHRIEHGTVLCHRLTSTSLLKSPPGGGTTLALCAFQTAIQEHAPEFGRRMGAMPATAVRVSPHERHLL